MSSSSSQLLPDVASNQNPTLGGSLNRVGMQNIELPIQLSAGDKLVTLPASLNLYVDLADPESKGIHMSRLYKIANEVFPTQALNYELIEEVLQSNLTSQKGISKEASLDIHFEIFSQRPSLVSGLKGWRTYPVHLSSIMTENGIQHTLEVIITYSSTCPCSASLARQLIQERFKDSFTDQSQLDSKTIFNWLGQEESICATPHSQRSTANVKVMENSSSEFDPLSLINIVEGIISTPVQAMVKREDEQKFALLNGQNLMFVEDASRKIKQKLEQLEYLDFRCEVKHMESLHPHDAVAIVTKGIPSGFHA